MSRAGMGRSLKIALFATGCSGIVAEFVLSTLATYLGGNAVLQWTLVMSLMLFSMGIGSRCSRHFHSHLLDTFIFTEFLLSLLCAVSAVFAYGLAAHTESVDLVIYGQSMIIGTLIGLEIPLVTRLNGEYEELRINISTVMEKDYYGALLGGLLFAFVALPYLGLTYTPILLGAVNFLVATLILFRYFPLVRRRGLLTAACGVTVICLFAIAATARPIIRYGEQKKYRDKIIHVEQTPYQKIVMTRWREDYWLYINGQEQFSTVDEELYHEPLVHPAMGLSRDHRRVLIIGGGDGLAAREVLKYPDVTHVTLVDLDPGMTRLAARHPVLLGINQGAFHDPRIRVENADAAAFLEGTAAGAAGNPSGFSGREHHFFGVVLVDLPDPDTVDLMHVYSLSFYQKIRRRLSDGGVMAVQATSPFFSPRAFRCILRTISAAGFSAMPYHNQVPTMGEWAWILAVPHISMGPEKLKRMAASFEWRAPETRFFNKDAMLAMMHFGKGVLEEDLMADVRVNTLADPVLYQYYLSGKWDLY
ncbi:MAG: spermidine synthase [Desulfobacterales bacterium]|nr:MAG: spermidine synthase [Desulfobacterales bacterium]